jgi:monoamine oxidase
MIAEGLESCDVVIVGAGAAGLAAAGQMGDSGLKIVILEARDRIGGRIFTLHDAAMSRPIELGAEFIHGLPPEIWEPLQTENVPVQEVDGDSWCVRDGRIISCDFFADVDEVLEKMTAAEPDESFIGFLRRHYPERSRTAHQQKILDRATAYVSGFNAADPHRIGVHWLVKGREAEEQIEGDRAFRAVHGYQDLLNILRKRLPVTAVYTDTVVVSIQWDARRAQIVAERNGIERRFAARAVLITLPIGVLKAPAGEKGAVAFNPPLPQSKLQALANIEMGDAARVTLRFKERFWQRFSSVNKKSLADMSFLFCEGGIFPTWWTASPEELPILTGWAPHQNASMLAGKAPAEAGEAALQAISTIFQLPNSVLAESLEASYFHDWVSDPFSRGAYSYGGVGADGAQELLGAPIEQTLFFAGEATDPTGNNGTVHAAIASGTRAAKEILAACRS